MSANLNVKRIVAQDAAETWQREVQSNMKKKEKVEEQFGLPVQPSLYTTNESEDVGNNLHTHVEGDGENVEPLLLDSLEEESSLVTVGDSSMTLKDISEEPTLSDLDSVEIVPLDEYGKEIPFLELLAYELEDFLEDLSSNNKN